MGTTSPDPEWKKGSAEQITISELDDMYPLRAGSAGSRRMAKHDAVPAGDASPGTHMDDLWRDLRYAGRAMRTNPLFVVFVVVTLGLGIGANTTVFTLINTLILNPLPVHNPSELAAVATVDAVATSESSTRMPISYPNLKDYQARNGAFRSLAGYTSMRVVTWQAGGASQGLFAEFVTDNYFSTLGMWRSNMSADLRSLSQAAHDSSNLSSVVMSIAR